jgi:ABC-type Fe3+-hydroxamate transport system substrate-binding protein
MFWRRAKNVLKNHLSNPDESLDESGTLLPCCSSKQVRQGAESGSLSPFPPVDYFAGNFLMPLFTDQTGRTINIPAVPRRIVSLVPSQTEFLFALGLDVEVVGITKFCIRPDSWFRHKTRVGGTKNPDIERILSLKPDLVIANKEENTVKQVLALAEIVPVWVSDVKDLPTAITMMQQVGLITGTAVKATEICSRINQVFDSFSRIPQPRPIKTAYLIWKDPFMTIGGDTFIHDMLNRCGLNNCFGAFSRYPVVTLQELKTEEIGLLLLSSEPYPFGQKDIDMLHLELPGTQVLLADGEYFSWYGSRLLGAPDYFTTLINSLHQPKQAT